MEIQKEFIGMIGLGYWGKNILRNLHDLGVLHTACDSDPGIVAERKKGFWACPCRKMSKEKI
jgi:UDP-2-acetamido-3-amino-2,3-dideoxy-glucuronate N-acetyltransferase